MRGSDVIPTVILKRHCVKILSALLPLSPIMPYLHLNCAAAFLSGSRGVIMRSVKVLNIIYIYIYLRKEDC